MKKLKVVPDIIDKDLEEAKKILEKKRITYNEKIKKLPSLKILPGNVVKTKPKAGEQLNEDDNVQIYISRKNTPLLVIFALLSLIVAIVAIGVLSFSKPLIETSTNILITSRNEWVKKAVVFVKKDSKMRKNISYYEYCINNKKNTYSCDWKATNTKSITVSESGIWYVTFRSVDIDGNRSSNSNTEKVYIDNNAPSIENIKALVTNSKIELSMDIEDELSGLYKKYYKVNDTDYIEFDSDIKLDNLNSNSKYIITIKAADMAGNIYTVELPIITRKASEIIENIEDETPVIPGEETTPNDNTQTNPENPNNPDDGNDEEEPGLILVPTIDLNNLPSEVHIGDDYILPSHYDYKTETGSVSCLLDDQTPINNINEIKDASEYKISCTVVNSLGLTASVEKEITVSVLNSDEVVKDGYLWLNLYYPENSTEWQWKIIDDSVDTEGWKYYTGPILVKLTDVDKVAIRYQLNGEIVTDLNSNNKFISIDPNRYVLIDDESSKVKLTYTENPVKVQYRINGSKWKEYDNEFYVDSAALVEAKATYDEPLYDENGNLIINRKKVVTAQTYIKENRGSVDYSSLFGKMNIEIVSTKTELQPAESAYITINYDIDATVKQYKIDSGNWTNYTGPFTVSEPCVIYARANGMRTIIVSDEKELSRNLSNTVSYRIYGDKVKEVLIDNIPTKIADDGQIIDLNKVKITPDKYSVAEDKFALITITTLTDANKVEYKINDEEWEEYTEPFYVRPLTTVKARAYFPLDKEDEEETYINLDTNTLQVYINSNKDKLFGNDKALITLTTNEKADKIEYSINNGAYKEYTEPFEVEHNQKIKARATKTYENNVKRESYSYLTLPTYYVGLSVKANPKSVLTGLTSTVTVDTYGFDFTSVEYSLDNVTYIPYTKSFEVLAGSTVYVRGLYHGEYINTTAHIDEIIPVEPLRGPEIIADPNTDTLEPVEITINTLESAYKKYYRINGGNWRSYETTFEVDKNCTIDAYYERLEDGKISEISTYYVDNIQIPNMPLVKIDVNPSDYNKKNYDQATITVVSTYANRVEYSFDNILYQEYTGPFTIDKTVTIYAKGINEYGETVTNKIVYLKKPASVPVSIEAKQLTLDIMSNPDNTITGLVNKTEVSILYDKLATQKLYKIGYYGTWQEYTGPFEVTNNTTIYAYASNDETSISKSYQVNFLTTGISDPVISLNTTKATYDANVTIKYAKTANVMKYKIGQYGDWQDYVEPFTVSENTTIYAYNEDVLGNSGTTSYTINNIIKRPKYTEIETDGYYLLKLNYPDIAIDKEYKWGQNGIWKPYNERGILLVKEKYKDELVSSDGVAIINDGQLMIFTDDYYVVDFDDPEAIAYNLFLRWDTYHPDGPRIVLETTEPVQETKAAIIYDSTIKAKYYKLVHNGVDTGWLEYTGPIDIKENYTTIYAYGVTNNGIDSKVSQYTVTNIDKDKPKITYSGDLINPRRYVGITIKATDNKGIEEVKWDEGNKDIKYFEDDGITVKNGSSIRIEENGTYTLYAIDKAGNSTVETFTVSNIDKDAPNIFIKVLTEELSGTVKVEVDYGDSTTKRYSFNNTTWMTYNEDSKITIKARDVLQYLNADKTLTVYARGTDKAGNPTTVSEIIYNLDTNIPGVPVINATALDYPTLSAYGVKISGFVVIDYDRSRDDAKHYYSIDNTNWYAYEGPFEIETTGKIYAKTITSTGLETKTEVSLGVATDALGLAAYDNNKNTTAGSNNAYKRLNVDSSIIGSKYYVEKNTSTYTYYYYNSQGVNIGSDVTGSTGTYIGIIPEGTSYMTIIGSIKECGPYNNPEITMKFKYPRITAYGVEDGYNLTEISYYTSAVKKEYRIENGEWINYTGPIKVTPNQYIYARSIDKYGNESVVSNKMSAYNSDSYQKTAFDGNTSTVSGAYNKRERIDLSENTWGNRYYVRKAPAGYTYYYYDANGNTIGNMSTDNKEYYEGVIPNGAAYMTTQGWVAEIDMINKPTIIMDYHYPKITPYGVEDGYNVATITYFPTAVAKEYKINDGEWILYTEPVRVSIDDTIYARSINRYGVESTTSSVRSAYVTNSLKKDSFDNNNSTSSGAYNAYSRIDFSEDMWNNRYFAVHAEGNAYTYRYYDKNGAEISSVSTTTNAKLVTTVPAGTDYMITQGWISELGTYNIPSMTSTYTYPTLTENGMNRPYNTYTVKYATSTIQKLYKINDGEWQNYTKPVDVLVGDRIYAKGVDKFNIDTEILDAISTNASNAIKDTAYDGNDESTDSSDSLRFDIDSSMYNKTMDFYWGYFTDASLSLSIYDKDGHVLATYNDSITTKKPTNHLKIVVPENSARVGYSASYRYGWCWIYIYEIRALMEPGIALEKIYPILTENSFISEKYKITVGYNSNTKNKLYSINSNEFEDYTKPFFVNVGDTVKAKAIIGDTEYNSNLTVSALTDGLAAEMYDQDINTEYTMARNETRTFYIDSKIVGRNIRLYTGNIPSNTYLNTYDRYGTKINTIKISSLVNVIETTENEYKYSIATGSSDTLIVKEINLGPALTENELNPIISTTDSGYNTSKLVDIVYRDGYRNEYSLDSGETWLEYTEPFSVDKNLTIFARSIDENDKIVGYSTFKVTKLVYTTLPDSITEGDNYLLTEYIVNAPKGNLVCKVGEDVITNTQNLTDGDHTINCDLTIDNKVLNITKELHVEAKPNEEIGIRGLSRRILNNNPNIKTNPTLSSTAEDAGENGLYSMEVTNGFGGTDGTTYFFRGNVNNNYVRFAGKAWRIVRINEDGTIRLVLNDAMNSTQYAYNNSNDNYKYLYYSNSNAKTQLDTWYQNNISSYSDMVASGKYFCEAARTKISDSYTANSASLQLYSSYTPDLKCVTDGNGYGLVNSNIGLLSYDEIAMAGATKNNSNFYLDDSKISYWWTMSPNGMNSSSSGANDFGGAVIWYVRPSGSLAADWNVNSVLPEYNAFLLRPVINLKPNVTFTGTGTSADPYVVTGIDNSLDNGTAWTYCGKDYDTCTLDNGTYNVKYGKDDTWLYKRFNGTFACSPGSFDNTDPLPGVVKGCYYQVVNTNNNNNNNTGAWTLCSKEGSSCSLPSGTHEVKYGLEDSWYYKNLSGTFTCNSTTFGGDPIFGKGKECYYR